MDGSQLNPRRLSLASTPSDVPIGQAESERESLAGVACFRSFPMSCSVHIRFLIRSWGKQQAKICAETCLVLVASGNTPILHQIFPGEACPSMHGVAAVWYHAIWCDCAQALCLRYLYHTIARCKSTSSLRLPEPPGHRRPCRFLQGPERCGGVLRLPRGSFFPLSDFASQANCFHQSDASFPLNGKNIKHGWIFSGHCRQRAAGYFFTKFRLAVLLWRGLRLQHGRDAVDCNDLRTWNTTFTLRLMQWFIRHTQCAWRALLTIVQPRAD